MESENLSSLIRLSVSDGQKTDSSKVVSFIGIYFVSLFDLILYVPSTIFQLCRDRYSWVEPVLS